MSDEINHRYTNEIVCPHCGYEQGDSWEADDAGEEFCQNDDCAKPFNYERHVEVTYCTSKPDEKA